MNHKTVKCKAITLITTSGKGRPIIDQLFAKGIKMLDLYHARGSFPGGPLDKKGNPIETEQDIVSCIIEETQAQDVFSLLYELAKIETEQGSLLYQRELGFSTQLSFSAS